MNRVATVAYVCNGEYANPILVALGRYLADGLGCAFTKPRIFGPPSCLGLVISSNTGHYAFLRLTDSMFVYHTASTMGMAMRFHVIGFDVYKLLTIVRNDFGIEN